MSGDGVPRRLQLLAFAFIVVVYLHNTLPYLTMMPRVNVDEPWLMERAYQVMQTGVPSQPMYGLTRAYFLQTGYPYLLAGWMQAFGVGLRQARFLGVVLGLGILIAVTILGRRLIGSAAGLSAALFLAADSNFLGGARNSRTDIPSVFFITWALACYAAGRPGSTRWLFASGVCAGLAMLCHANAFWVVIVLFAWILVDHGRAAFFRAPLYWIAAGVATAFGPYAAIILVNRTEVSRQVNAFVPTRVPELSLSFVREQVSLEIERYRSWYFGLVTNTVPDPILWVFQAAAMAGSALLLARLIGAMRRRQPATDGWLLLTLIAGSVTIFATLVTNKVPVYMPHLLIGFSLAAGLCVAESANALGRWSGRPRALTALVLAFIVGYGSAAMAYYEKWYSSTRKSELVPYEQTTETLRALVPAGPKYVYGSPHFWIPFHGDPETLFTSYALGLNAAHTDRPIYLLVDESQWLPDMAQAPALKRGWVAFIDNHCALDRVALGTAYGTIASYRCGAGDPPASHTPAIIGGSTLYRIGDEVSNLTPADLMKWNRNDDSRRRPSDRPEVVLTPDGVRIAGTGWPGLVTPFAATPGQAYLIRVAAARTHGGDLLYLGTWKERQVLSLSGAASSGMPTPLGHAPWFPGDRAFIATAPRVQVLIYSEAPQTDFIVKSVEILRLQPMSERSR